MSKELNEIQRTLGRIEQGLKDLNERVQHNCEVTEKNIALINAKIDGLESFRDNLQGRMTIIGTISGFVGGLITVLIQLLFKKL